MPKFFEPEDKDEEEAASSPTGEPLASKIGEAGEVKTLLTWEAPSRPFRKKSGSYYRTIAILVVLLATIALLAQEFLLIGALLALTFVTYVLAFVPPNKIGYKISTQGIIVGDQFYFWHTLDSFWFREKEGQKVLMIQTMLRFPGQLMLVLGPSAHSMDSGQAGSGQGPDEEEVKKVVARFLPYHELHQPPILERWSEALQKHFPLENIH